MTEATPSAARARKPDGKFKGDNPATPGLNEAWEATDIAEALPKALPMSSAEGDWYF